MDAEEKPLFFVLYSAHHERCGEFLERADSRITTKEDLLRWSQGMLPGMQPDTLPIHCYKCAEDVTPTHLRIIAEVGSTVQSVVPEIEIKKFNPGDWILPKNS
ncbi:MAG: hypothetical protein HY088_06250 [Ignavibacteriales bacterium]|nr:hypothetical protein [Ignavibacteriales bacterium]